MHRNLPELDFDPFGLSLLLVRLLRAQGGRLMISVGFCCCHQLCDFRRWLKVAVFVIEPCDGNLHMSGELLGRVWRFLKMILQSGCAAVTGCSDLLLCPI